MGGIRWTEEEINILKDNYSKLSRKEMEQLLPNRNWMTISKRANEIGLARDVFWTEKEINLLKENYNLPINELIKLFPNRTKGAIEQRINVEGLYRGNNKKWTIEEITILKNNSHLLIDELILLFPDRTKYSVIAKAQELGVYSKQRNRSKWTDNELNILYKCFSTKEAQDLLTNKTLCQIYSKLQDLNIKYERIKWDKNNDNDLINNYHKLTKEELIKRYSIGWHSISNRAKYLNLGARLHDDVLLLKRKEIKTNKRVCNTCKKEKELDLSNYRKDDHARLGFSYSCKECEEKKYPRKTNIRHGEKIEFNNEEIINLYCNEGWSLTDLAKYYHRGQIFFKEILLKNNVQIRTHGEQFFWENKNKLDEFKKELINDYINNFYTLGELEDKYKVNRETIRYYLYYNNIEVKNNGESCSLREFRDNILPYKNKIIDDYCNNGIAKCAEMNKTSKKTIYRLLDYENIDIYYKSKYVTGTFYSEKMSKKFIYRSSYERDYFEMLEYNNNVSNYEYEVLYIPYYYNGEWHNYKPDFLITYINGCKEIHEVKPNSIILYDEEVRVKANYAKEYCKDNNMVYKFITENELYLN